MDVAIIEALRCPGAHDEAWLVVVPRRRDARGIADGTVGCPVCGREWALADGRLLLGADETVIDADGQARESAVHGGVRSADAAVRAAALLDLRSSGGLVLLGGEAARLADGLAALADVRVLAVNAPTGVARSHARLAVGSRLPLGVGTLRGAMLDAATARFLPDVVRAIARGGRLVAPASVDVPTDHPALRELARDTDDWVAEVHAAASGLVPLRRATDGR